MVNTSKEFWRHLECVVKFLSLNSFKQSDVTSISSLLTLNQWDNNHDNPDQISLRPEDVSDYSFNSILHISTNLQSPLLPILNSLIIFKSTNLGKQYSKNTGRTKLLKVGQRQGSKVSLSAQNLIKTTSSFDDDSLPMVSSSNVRLFSRLIHP
ncbi:hypothetical protein GEMRC1_002554 [Eukaryota sp. GEM-RC1]